MEGFGSPNSCQPSQMKIEELLNGQNESKLADQVA
jgi:hypothetical protein